MRYTQCQERYKFIENPVAYIKNLLNEQKNTELKNLPKKRLFDMSYNKRVDEYIATVNKKYANIDKKAKELAAEYSSPTYVYYNEQKLAVPNSFYIDYKTPDIEGYIKYLVAEDEARNIITDEDREKARLLNCDLDYNYLQTLINKMNINPDLVITIRTKDGATINMRKQTNKEPEDLLDNSIFISPEMVK